MSNPRALIHALALAGLATACAPVQSPPAASETYSGWYMQHGTGASLQPCGEPASLRVANGETLRSRAAGFGLQDDLPVYVRVRGTRSDGEFRLAAVEQFGSEVPVRTCGMTGTSIQQ